MQMKAWVMNANTPPSLLLLPTAPQLEFSNQTLQIAQHWYGCTEYPILWWEDVIQHSAKLEVKYKSPQLINMICSPLLFIWAVNGWIELLLRFHSDFWVLICFGCACAWGCREGTEFWRFCTDCNFWERYVPYIIYTIITGTFLLFSSSRKWIFNCFFICW